jgi:cytochrome c551/c552
MKILLKIISLFFLGILCLPACQNSSETNNGNGVIRPANPWVFRSVLDVKPRMVTFALNDNLWAAYSTQNGSLYKVWKGYVEFDGAVYTTAHGPQPTSVGDAYILGEHETPWLILENGNEVKPEFQYKGHRYTKNGHAQLMYELSWNGKKATVTEQPEYFEAGEGLAGFERIFTTSKLPEGSQIALMTNVSSVVSKQKVETNGEFKIGKETARDYKDLKGVDIDGQLVLNSNEETRFAAQFMKRPLIEDPNKKNEEEEELQPLGQRLIARSDCKSCHNTFRKTIGPAYIDIAKKYKNNDQNIALLSAKVKNGGYGVWGPQVMSAHPDVPDSDIKEMVSYVMSLDAEEEAKMAAVAKVAPEDLDYIYGQKNLVEEDLLPGVIFKIYQYDFDIKKLADLKKDATPIVSGIVEDIHADGNDLKAWESNFAIIAEGYLNIEKAENYNFRLISDDGSRLIIGDKEIINHDGLHGAEPKDGSIALAEGFHKFKIEFFQGYGGKGLFLQWRNDGEYQKVPAAAFVHNKKDEPDNLVADVLNNTTKIPGDASPLNGVHPSYDLTQARPPLFTPRVGGMDFLSDGRMVVCTWDANGSVYILDGVQSGDSSKITHKLIGAGLAEPLGLKVVDDEIYVLQKQELTKLVDTDGDDLIDEYQTICNAWRVSANFHEFAFGLVYKEGFFYGTLATAINPGGASTQPQIQDRGKVVKISKADGSMELIAAGLRTPNGIGLGVDNEIFVADNQGDWLPASKIVHVKEGGWYGSRSVDFEGTEGMKENLPVVWLPQDEIGNSPSAPTYINDGPYKGQMIHGEVTNGGIKRVFVEKVNGDYQGCLFRFTQGMEAGVNRIIWGPDGALYVGGVGSTGNWVHDGKLWYGLQRFKYNEASTFEMLAVRAKSNGMEIEFTEPLPEGEGWEKSNYLVKRWYYKPTENYGGPKIDETGLNIRSVKISEDRKKVFLEFDGMKPNHMIYIKLDNSLVSENNHKLWSTEAWYTLNQVPEG